MAGISTFSHKRFLLAAAGAATLALGAPAATHATSASSELNLNGGDKLEADAFHCTTYFRHCSWQASAKLIGNSPKRATWIQNSAKIEGHGISAKISLGKSVNVEVTFKSKALIKTRWRNTKSWISWSKGKVNPSFSTAWVSTESRAYAFHKRFGKPGPVVAYAGAV